MKARRRAPLLERLSHFGEESCANTPSLHVRVDMQVLQDGPAYWVFVEDDVREPDKRPFDLADRCELVADWCTQSLAPSFETIGDGVIVEEGVGVDAPVVLSPTVGMKGGYHLDIIDCR
jgi:hypothetical protein